MNAIMVCDAVDVVFGIQEKRKGGIFERVSGGAFYKVFNLLSSQKLPENVLTVRLMTRSYVDALLKFNESELFIHGVWVSTGFKQKQFPIKKTSKGTRSYTISKSLSLMLSAITSFSSKPLYIIGAIGAIIWFLSLLAITFLIAKKIWFGSSVEGWASVMVSLWFIGGLIVMSIGVLGVYIGKIFSEVKNRPNAIVRSHYP